MTGQFEVTSAPSIWRKDHVVLKTLSELRRLCEFHSIPLLHISHAQHHIVNIPVSDDAPTYDLYFSQISGLYYTYTEQSEDTEGVSS